MRTKEGKFIVFKIIVIAILFFLGFKNYQAMELARDGSVTGLTDETITNQLRGNQHEEIIYTIFGIVIAVCCFIAIVYFVVKLKREKGLMKGTVRTVLCVILIFLLGFIGSIYFSVLSYKSIDKSSNIADSNDWTISFATVKNKNSTMGRKFFNNYFIDIENNKEIKVDGIEYAYINEGDQIYCIYDRNDELIKIYSPRMYNYEGKKLNSKNINISRMDNSNAIRYCTDIFIIYCVILVSLILGTIIELIINTKYIDEKERLFHKDPINIRKRKRN